LSQTFTDFECILINDCSLDNSGNICDKYSENDNRIKVIHNLKNIGSSLSRNTGLKYSSCNYIIFVDSDDWIEPNTLELVINMAITENFDIIVFGCYKNYEDGTNNIIQQDFNHVDNINFIKKIIKNSIKAYLCNKLLKKDILMNINFPIHSRSEDYAIIIQYIYLANKIGFLNLPLYHYYYNSLSLSNNKERKILGQNEEIQNWCFILNFLKSKYTNLNIFEPELSNRINNIYYTKHSDKLLKKKLIQLYPESRSFLQTIKYLPKLIIKRILPNKIFILIKNIRRHT